MKASSAMALVSAMLGAAMPLTASAFAAWATGSFLLAQPARATMATAIAAHFTSFRRWDLIGTPRRPVWRNVLTSASARSFPQGKLVSEAYCTLRTVGSALKEGG